MPLQVRADKLFDPRYNPFTELSDNFDKILVVEPVTLAQMRKDTYGIRPDVKESVYGERVLCSLNTLLEKIGGVLRAQLKNDAEKISSTVACFRRGFVFGVWALSKTAAAFSQGDALNFAADTSSWWKDYTTDWVLERFTCWSVYLSLKGIDDNCLGYFVGFEIVDGKPALFCQELHEIGGYDPLLFHVFPFEPGMKLGDIAQAYEFTDPLSEVFVDMFCQQRHMSVSQAKELLNQQARRVACRMFALLTAFLSEDFRRQSFVVDIASNCYIEGQVDMPKRNNDDLSADGIKRKIVENAGALFRVSAPEVPSMTN